MRKTKFTNLYDVIRALHGNRLPVRASERFSTSSAMQVYLGMRRIGTVDEVRTMSPMNILTVRVFDPMQVSAYGAWTMARARCW